MLRQLTRAVALATAMLLMPPAADAAEKKLIFFVSNATSYASSLAANVVHVDLLPFDGVAVNSDSGWNVMRPGHRLSYSTAYGHLSPIKGRLAKVTHNFAVAYVDRAADVFDDWSWVIQNWIALARAARDAGYEGILFDNEEYKGQIWHYPNDMKYRSSRSQGDYQRQFRTRGRQVMEAIRSAWPAVKVMHMHGPYVSDRRTPDYVTMLQVGTSYGDMRGHFFVGMMEAATGSAEVIDGGEVYQYRTPTDFQRSYDWRKNRMQHLTPNALVPSTLKAQWAGKSNIAFGTYDMQWLSGYTMTPAILTSTLRNALAQADEYVWLFTEWGGPNQYLKPGGAPRRWIDAVRAAR